MDEESFEQFQYEELDSYYSALLEKEKDLTKVIKSFIKFDNMIENKKDKIFGTIYESFKIDLYHLLEECLYEINDRFEYSKENYCIETYFNIFENISDLVNHYEKDDFNKIPVQLNNYMQNLDKNIMILFPVFDLEIFSNKDDVLYINYLENIDINLQ